jgi:hypothetical protein
MRGARRGQRTRRLHRAVSVSIGFEDGKHHYIRPNGLLDALKILLENAAVDPRVGSHPSFLRL